jgi:two-component SAPR family response regulator
MLDGKRCSLSFEENLTEIKVKMFGEFSIEINGNTLTNFKGRTKRVWMLIQYLIIRRRESIGLNEILEDIWEGHDCGDPENALKNLIYRARVLLHGLSRQEHRQFIVFMNGTYLWNNQYSCTVDAERFAAEYREAARTENPAEVRIEAYRNALELYTGEFLPKSCYSRWVVQRNTAYADLCKQCVQSVCVLLNERKRYEEVVSICEKALHYFPYEEAVHKVLLAAYVDAGQRSRAFEHYNWATNVFYREFGVDLSETFLPYYRRLISGSSKVEPSLSAIKKELKESSGMNGAFFCDYDIFKSIYQSQVRILSRTGQSVFLALFTISNEEGDTPKAEISRTAMEKLKSVMVDNLRKGDTVAGYSSTQFLAMLPFTTFENAQSVTDRIYKKFRFEYRRDNVEITVKLSPME